VITASLISHLQLPQRVNAPLREARRVPAPGPETALIE
jgi:hypothetical protein